MENLKQRIKTTKTIVDEGWVSLVHGQILIMNNQVAIMEALVEIQNELDKIPKKPDNCGFPG